MSITTTFDMVIVLGGVCGLVMVVGGILLFYKGAISLKEASSQGAVDLEFKKMFRITTHYPALGFFIIGLLFIVTAAMFSKPARVSPLRIEGKLNVLDPSSVTIRVSAGNWMLEPSTDGTIKGTIYPDMDILKVEITAPGYIPPSIKKTLRRDDIKAGTALLGEIAFQEKRLDKPPVDPGKIVAAPPSLPHPSAPGKF